jgi:hypothetical protein
MGKYGRLVLIAIMLAVSVTATVSLGGPDRAQAAPPDPCYGFCEE